MQPFFVPFVFFVVKKGQSLNEYNLVAESNNVIIREIYNRDWKLAEGYQSEGIVDKPRRIHVGYSHDYVFDDGHIQSIYLLDW